MKRYLTCALGTVLLAACTSAGTLRNSAPTAVYRGDTRAEDVISCVADAWASKKLPISAVPLTSGTSIQLQETEDGPVVALVDITPTGATTTAKYFSRMTIDDSWFFEQVKNCM